MQFVSYKPKRATISVGVAKTSWKRQELGCLPLSFVILLLGTEGASALLHHLVLLEQQIPQQRRAANSFLAAVLRHDDHKMTDDHRHHDQLQSFHIYSSTIGIKQRSPSTLQQLRRARRVVSAPTAASKATQPRAWFVSLQTCFMLVGVVSFLFIYSCRFTVRN